MRARLGLQLPACLAARVQQEVVRSGVGVACAHFRFRRAGHRGTMLIKVKVRRCGGYYGMARRAGPVPGWGGRGPVKRRPTPFPIPVSVQTLTGKEIEIDIEPTDKVRPAGPRETVGPFHPIILP